MATKALTKENFSTEVDQSDIAVLDFWAPWCGPCKMFGPVFEEVSGQYPEVLFGKINTEDEQELGAHFNIRSIPTLMIIRDGVVLYSQPGALPKHALADVVKQASEIDMAEVHSEIARQQQANAES